MIHCLTNDPSLAPKEVFVDDEEQKQESHGRAQWLMKTRLLSIKMTNGHAAEHVEHRSINKSKEQQFREHSGEGRQGCCRVAGREDMVNVEHGG